MIRRWLLLTTVLALAGVLLDWLVLGEHHWKFFPGFYALFGLMGAGIVIAVAAFTGRYILGKDETYYQRDTDDD